MGRGIAQCFALCGYTVVMTDISAALAESGCAKVRSAIERLRDKGRITPDKAESAISSLVAGEDYSALKDCSLVVEAALEELDTKKRIFALLEDVVSESCILASNTSSISLTDIADGLRQPQRTAGMHFFNPAPTMKLVEVVRGAQTSDAVVAAVSDYAVKLGKTPVVSLDSPGFIVNRVLAPMMNEAIILLESGVSSREEIDSAMKLGANHPMGPLALADMVGLDVLLHVMEYFAQTLDPVKYAPAPLLEQMVREGKLGAKSGEGFYKY
jgi:3-hydroxybutyryl-CoA dehydrogenase